MTKFKVFLTIFLLIVFYFLVSVKQHNEKTELVFWTVQLAPFTEYINGVITDFEEQYPYIHVKWVDVPYAEAEKRVLASLLSNSVPDLVNITSDFNMMLARKGALLSVDGDMKECNEALKQVLTYSDKVWGVPFYATSAITIYNKDLLVDFGVKKIAKNYDDLWQQMQRAPMLQNKYLFMPTLTENDTLYKLLNKYEINNPQELGSDKAIILFDTLKSLYINEKMPKEAITQTHREVLEKYSSGQIAYLQTGANFLNIIKENSLDVYEKTDVAPQFYGEKEGYDFSLMTLAVPKKAKNSKEAFLFAKFLTSEENQINFAKLTGILPCNKQSLNNEYFQNYDDDIVSKARYIGAKQLSSPIKYPIQNKSHKEIIEILNNLVAQVLVGNKDITVELEQVQYKWKLLLEN